MDLYLLGDTLGVGKSDVFHSFVLSLDFVAFEYSVVVVNVVVVGVENCLMLHVLLVPDVRAICVMLLGCICIPLPSAYRRLANAVGFTVIWNEDVNVRDKCRTRSKHCVFISFPRASAIAQIERCID